MACEQCDCATPIQINQLALEKETELGVFSSYSPRSRLFPTETELIHLVCLEYELDIKDTCIHACHNRYDGLLNPLTSRIPVVGPTSAKEIRNWCNYLDNDDRKWRLVATFAQESK